MKSGGKYRMLYGRKVDFISCLFMCVMGVYGCLVFILVTMGIWLSIDVHAYIWVSMGFYEYWWVSTGISGCLWVSLGISWVVRPHTHTHVHRDAQIRIYSYPYPPTTHIYPDSHKPLYTLIRPHRYTKTPINTNGIP